TAPDQTAQEAMLRAAYTRAGIAPEDVQYVELHGTGTPLGDRVEASALGSVLGANRPAERPLAVGSVKTNVGHLEAAAGSEGLLDGLGSLASAQPSPHVIEGVADPDLDGARPVFVFPGQGGQWLGMAVELMDQSPRFTAEMRDCESALADYVDFSIDAVLR